MYCEGKVIHIYFYECVQKVLSLQLVSCNLDRPMKIYYFRFSRSNRIYNRYSRSQLTILKLNSALRSQDLLYIFIRTSFRRGLSWSTMQKVECPSLQTSIQGVRPLRVPRESEVNCDKNRTQTPQLSEYCTTSTRQQKSQTSSNFHMPEVINAG